MRYTKFAVLVFFICITALYTAYLIYQKGFNTYYSVEQQRLQHIINGKEKHDILFLGASRMIHHINPRIVDSITSMNSYNAGIDGCNLLEMNLVLQCYVASHPAPKIVVVDLPISAFAIDFKPVYNPNIYFQYLSNPIVYHTLQPFARVSLLKNISFLQLTETDDFLRQNALLGCLGKESSAYKDNYKGFIPYAEDTIKLPFRNKYLTAGFPVDEKGKSILNDMIQTCKNNNIQLMISYAPVYNRQDEPLNESFFPTIENVCAQYRIPFLNHRNEDALSSNTVFIDEHHLNKTGADIYSAMLAKDIIQCKL